MRVEECPAMAHTPADSAAVRCDTCQACCCRLKVVLQPEDAVPDAYIDADEHGMPVMARLDDGWCIALDRDTMRCTIYADRPLVCREFAMGGADCLEERAAWLDARR